METVSSFLTPGEIGSGTGVGAGVRQTRWSPMYQRGIYTDPGRERGALWLLSASTWLSAGAGIEC
jgi:hypothetical protein